MSDARRYPGSVGTRTSILILLALLTMPARDAAAFSVLAHQAVVDRSWDATIAPAISGRYPGADLERARAFAHGGSHVADLGYFPFGSALFTQLLHYVRTGDFVRNLLGAARDANEYAFGLGMLAHWIADTTGHPEATNRIVPELYPKLREEFGDEVTYADDHAAHFTTEFRFDALQIARSKAGRDIFHHSLQFEVATRALEEAFEQTYGLRPDDVMTSTDAAILTYRYAIRGLIHQVTGIAWQLYQADIQTLDPTMTPAGFVYDLSREDFEHEFGKVVTEPGYFAKFFAVLVKLVPDVGPLKPAIMKPLPADAQKRYEAALDHALTRYRAAIEAATAKRLDLPELNLDTARPVTYGQYAPADEAYAGLATKLAERGAAVPAELRADLARFYASRPARAARDDDDDERELDATLARLAVASAPGNALR